MKPAGGCNSFSEQRPKTPPSKPSVASELKKAKRANPTSMDIEVDHKGVTHSVKVLRPIDKRDNLWVKYDADQLGVVIDLLRCSEWQYHEPWGLSTGTKIIYRMDKKFLVTFGKVSNTGKKKSRQ